MNIYKLRALITVPVLLMALHVAAQSAQDTKSSTAAATTASVASAPSEQDEAFRESLLKLVAATGDGFRALRGSRWGSRGAENVYNTDFVVPGAAENRIYGTKKGAAASFTSRFRHPDGSNSTVLYEALRRRIPALLPDFNYSEEMTDFGATLKTTRFVSAANPAVVITLGREVVDGKIDVLLTIGSPDDYTSKQLVEKAKSGLLVRGKIITDKLEQLDPSSGYTGQGTFNWPDNKQSYTGSWVSGKPEGRGRFTFSQGHYYEGDIKGGRATGHGVYYTQGYRYTGEFLDGLYNGYGELYSYSDRSTVKGQFADNRPVPGKTTTVSGTDATGGAAVQLSPERQRIIDQYNEDMNPRVRKAKEESEALSRRIAEDKRKLENNYHESQNRAQQAAQEETQRNIDARNRELDKQDKKFNEKYNR